MGKRAKKNKEAGEAFKKLLKDKGFSQYKLEQVTGIDKSVISKIVNGYTAEPKLETLEKIAAALGVELTQLTEIFTSSNTKSSHSTRNPQSQELVSEVEISNDCDFLECEEDIESSIMNDMDKLVQEVRHIIQPLIQEQCGTMKILDREYPIGLDDIYIDVNILEKIPGRKRLEMSESLHNNDDKVDGFKAVQDYSKLMVFGKPGAGKTTFLKKLAIKCINGKFQANKVPFFITLKEWSESPEAEDLLNFIRCEFFNNEFSVKQIEYLFRYGRVLLLLDGLDEVVEEYVHKILKSLKLIFRRYHSNNFLITCRIAAREYTFDAFNEVAIADFDYVQIEIFVDKFFSRINPKLSDKFMEQIEEIDQFKELAKSPILLTFLCLEFEDNGTFTNERAELYKRVTRILLKKWDEKRDINRSNIFTRLNIHTKETFLSYVAFNTFTRNQSSFKEIHIQEYIYDYIKTLPNNPVNSELLQLDIEDIIKSIQEENGLIIEIGRGIYSFSHRTFHEYFTAKYIVDNLNNSYLENIANKVINFRWQEVFILIFEMLDSSDNFLWLIQQEINKFVASSEELQQFLSWLNHKYLSLQLDTLSMQPISIRSIQLFYISLCLNYFSSDDFRDNDWEFYFTIAQQDTTNQLEYDLHASKILGNSITLFDVFNQSLKFDLYWDDVNELISSFDYYINYLFRLNISPQLNRWLYVLKERLPIGDDCKNSYEEWWQSEGYDWIEELRAAMIIYRNIGYDWKFRDKIKQYYYANKLLVNCLQNFSDKTRESIEKSLLVPSCDIEWHPDLIESPIISFINRKGEIQYAYDHTKIKLKATGLDNEQAVQLNFLDL